MTEASAAASEEMVDAKQAATLRAIALLLLLSASPLRAAFEDVGSGGRAPGMGNAFTAIADDAYAVYYNPAGLAQLDRPQVSAAYSRLHLGLSDGSDIGISQLTTAAPLRGGRWGTLGLGYQRLALSGLYAEESLYLSAGRSLWETQRGRLMGGLSAKYLRRSFAQLSEAFAACDGLLCNQGADPVLSAASSQGLLDLDAGLLYRHAGRWSIGAAARHLARPNIAFGSAPERLPLDLRFGAAYHALWLNLAGDLHLDRDPSGALGRRLVLAAERFFPTLEHGQLGVRGALGLESPDWRQLSLGLSYRISKLQIDYAFLTPLGAIQGTQGTHRVALTILFGGLTPEEELAAGLMDRLRKMRDSKRGVDFIDLEAALTPADIKGPQLAQVLQAVEAREYRKAYQLLRELVRADPRDEALGRLLQRLDTITAFYTDLPAPAAAWERSLTEGIRAFLEAQDNRAVLQVSHAASLQPDDVRLDRFLGRLEDATRVKALRLPSDHPRGFVAELLYRSELAFKKADYTRVLDLANNVLVVERENSTALERVASIHHLMGQHEKALEGWRRALAVEQNPRERLTLEHHIAEAERRLGMTRSRPASGGAAPEPGPVTPRADVRTIEELYQKGVEHFARGETLQATGAFLRVLQLDPGNAPAQKALERIRRTAPRRPRP